MALRTQQSTTTRGGVQEDECSGAGPDTITDGTQHVTGEHRASMPIAGPTRRPAGSARCWGSTSRWWGPSSARCCCWPQRAAARPASSCASGSWRRSALGTAASRLGRRTRCPLCPVTTQKRISLVEWPNLHSRGKSGWIMHGRCVKSRMFYNECNLRTHTNIALVSASCVLIIYMFLGRRSV